MALAHGLMVVFFLLSSSLRASMVIEASDPELFFDWTVSYSHLFPFGVDKKVIMINNQFPGPLLNATTNNVIHVTIFNQLDEPFLLAWNGLLLRRNSWNDGVQGTNCPIPPGGRWTYVFQLKDQIGSYFYFPSVGLQKAAGGYGPIRVNNRPIIPIPFDFPRDDFDILIGDWYNADYKAMGAALDQGLSLPTPDGILINGLPTNMANFTFQPGATYRLRISNVGTKTSLNFRIQGHWMLLVETEGSYTLRRHYTSLDIHVGQSYSVLVTADQPANASYYMVASSRFILPVLYGVAAVQYEGSSTSPSGSLPEGPLIYDYVFSMEQARSIRQDLAVGAARPNPQGTFRYASISVARKIVLHNDEASIGGRRRCTVNGVSFSRPDTPLKLADYYKIPGVFAIGEVADEPDGRAPELGTPVIDVLYRGFIEIVFQNDRPAVQSWHLDGYNFFVVGMGSGRWNDALNSTYNMGDAVARSTVQVYPFSWTAIFVSLDNLGMWNLRSQDWEGRYLGQEVYIRVRGDDPNAVPSPRDEKPIPSNVLLCGRATNLFS